MKQDARVELHEQQPGIKRVAALFVREHVVPTLGQSISQGLENRSNWWVGWYKSAAKCLSLGLGCTEKT